MNPLSYCIAVLAAIGMFTPNLVAAEPEPNWIELEHRIPADDGHLRWVAFSPDGQHVAACGDRLIQMYDVTTAKPIRQFRGHQQHMHRFAFSPDGTLIASAGHDHTIRVWKVATGEEVALLHGHTDAIIGVGFSNNGQWIVSASAFHDGSIRIWSTADWSEVASTKIPKLSNAMFAAFSPNNRLIAASEYRGGVRLFEFDGRAIRPRFAARHLDEEMVPHVSFSPDGQTILTSGWDRRLRLWRVSDGAPIWDVPTPPYARCFEAAVFNSDGSQIYCVTRDETIQRRDATTGKLERQFRWQDQVRGLALSSDGRHIATAGHRGAIKVWKLRELD